MVGILLVLVLSALLLGWFGIGNIRSALTYPGRVTGAFLVGSALIALFGAWAVVDHWYRNSFERSGLAALAGTVAALLANLMLLYETLNGDSLGYRVLWSLLTAGSLWAVIAVWRTSVVIPAPKQVAAVALITTLIAVGNWSYQHLYQPNQRGAKPLIKVTIGKPLLGQNRKAFSVPVDIKLENPSDVGFYVLGAEFHAMGESVPLSPRDRLRKQWRADAEQWSKAQYQETHPLSRREIHQPGELVAAQPWIPAGIYVEARDEFSTRTVVQLPTDTRYDQLAFYASVSLARKDRLGLEQVAPQGNSWSPGSKVPKWIQKDLDSVIFRGRVYENNVIDAHTMDPRYVTVFWRFGQHGADVLGFIRRDGEEDLVFSREKDRRLAERYGLVKVQTGPYERTLWDVKDQR
ncbi:hypothetical protein [Streptomyces sp. NPDC059894]|uniref:hypothetical protein n=1 Tax=unclassified Streptomyces TaxID=2593676 RepID=UPI00364C803C